MSPKVIGKKCDIGTQKVLIAAEYVNCKVDVQEPKDGTLFKLVTSEGSEVGDVLSALRYFARIRPDVALYGRTFDEMALVDSWLQYTESQVTIPLIAWITWKNLHGECIEKIKSDITKAVCNKIESHLLSHTFLAGERLSIADINLALTLNQATSMYEGLLKDFPNSRRWLSTVIAQNPVKKYLGGVSKKECKKESPKKVAPKGEKKEPTAVDIEDEIAAEEKARSKKANPLDSLPASPFILDAWKREYSNTKDLKGVALPWFWKNFDSAGWSIWYMRYDKMEGENTVGFTTANMLGGFLQRLDGNFRKYSFGVINVVGSSGNFDIQGVWLMRGQEIPFEMKDHPSFEYHTFRKLDPIAEKDLIEEYWCNEDAVEGRSIDSCKVWK